MCGERGTLCALQRVNRGFICEAAGFSGQGWGVELSPSLLKLRNNLNPPRKQAATKPRGISSQGRKDGLLGVYLASSWVLAWDAVSSSCPRCSRWAPRSPPQSSPGPRGGCAHGVAAEPAHRPLGSTALPVRRGFKPLPRGNRCREGALLAFPPFSSLFCVAPAEKAVAKFSHGRNVAQSDSCFLLTRGGGGRSPRLVLQHILGCRSSRSALGSPGLSPRSGLA